MNNKLNIEYVDINDIKEYKNNAKKHPKKQIEQIKQSIEKFGMDDPIGVWNNEIVEGHGRYIACKELGMKEIPIIRLDHLNDEERKAYTLIHNKLTMNSDFDLDILNEELISLQDLDIDLDDFDLEIRDFELEHEEYQERTQKRVANILNLGQSLYEGKGKYDIPDIKPIRKIGEIKKWIPFNYVLSDDNPEGKAVHFYIDDYQFERIWKNPDKYVDKLRRYEAVCSPDFSPYANMPLATQIFNHYRKHWVAKYLQDKGVKIIPTIRASRDERSFEFYLEGEPKGGIVTISSMWTNDEESLDYFLKEYNTMYDALKPIKVYLYGKKIDGLRGNIEFIECNAKTIFGGKNGKR